jgi:hypothetical protein
VRFYKYYLFHFLLGCSNMAESDSNVHERRRNEDATTPVMHAELREFQIKSMMDAMESCSMNFFVLQEDGLHNDKTQ